MLIYRSFILKEIISNALVLQLYVHIVKHKFQCFINFFSYGMKVYLDIFLLSFLWLPPAQAGTLYFAAVSLPQLIPGLLTWNNLKMNEELDF